MKVIATFLFPFRPLKLNVKANINQRVFMYGTRLHRTESEGTCSLTDVQGESREQLKPF